MTEIPSVDDAVKEVPTPDEPVPEHAPVPDPPADENPPADDDNMRPGFVDEILDRLDSLADAIKGDVPEALEPVIPDESPVKAPWTHRNPFKKG